MNYLNVMCSFPGLVTTYLSGKYVFLAAERLPLAAAPRCRAIASRGPAYTCIFKSVVTSNFVSAIFRKSK